MVLSNKIHDLHPKIAPSGLYWTVPIPPSAVSISTDGKSSTMEVNDVALFDEPQWPTTKGGPYTPAVMSLRVEWTAIGPQQTTADPAKHFRVLGYPAQARASFKVAIPSENFVWQSDPGATSTSEFATIGDEVNGSYYDQEVTSRARHLPKTGGPSPSIALGVGLGVVLMGILTRARVRSPHQ